MARLGNPGVALATVRGDIVLRSLGADAPTRGIWLACQEAGHVAPSVAPMRAILRRVAEEHGFTCDVLVAAGR